VSTPSYLISHVVGSVGGTILAIFAVLGLGAYLAPTRAGPLGLAAMVTTALGHALLLVPATISTFATPAIGRAYLSGLTDVMQIEFSEVMTWLFLIGLLLAFVGSVLLGVAMWRSQLVPRAAAALWMIASVVFYPLGVVLGMATTNASLPTQSVGALLFAVSGGWIAWSALGRRRAPSRVAAPA
jgi:glucan phosphoethanolaminetransferase (alkaline phosphatase superfamily)